MTVENLHKETGEVRQELLGFIFNKFVSFPPTDIEVNPNDESDLGVTLFSYRFPKGTTTPEFSDHLSGKRNLNTGEVSIFYAKGIHAGRVTLVKNAETEAVELKSFIVYQKEVHKPETHAYQLNPSASKPHLHAIESLLKDIEAKMIEEPSLFKTQAQLIEETQKQKEMLRLYAIIVGRVEKKKNETEKAKRLRGRRR